MRITTTRRISQIFFFTLFMWFCIAATLGTRWWQLRGWPVNWLLQLDPLHGLGVLLATHSIYSGLLWGAATLTLTMIVGRFFCGWLCPFGALQQFMGYIGKRHLKTAGKITRNRPHQAQRIKYWLLLFILAAAAGEMFHYLFRAAHQTPVAFWLLMGAITLVLLMIQRLQLIRVRKDFLYTAWTVAIAGMTADLLFPNSHWLSASLQSGLLDPIALMHRSVNIALLPLADAPFKILSTMPRVSPGAFVIGALFLLFTLLCLRIPRFYCRFICPLGALFGLLSRWNIWRIGRNDTHCKECRKCERDCEGACLETGVVKISECVLCLNCLEQCRHEVMTYQTQASTAGEIPAPDLTRRQVVTALSAGLIAAPLLRVPGNAGAHWNPAVIRPPGALAESDFLSRCIKCGQCMRICPTNVIHPAGLQSGLEGLWTPMLNYRMGTSGCQHNCVACSQICPTAALRPLTVDERMGRGTFSDQGPIRTGMAFIDRGRCLPWAMDTPCIVCQENCPVSPKAIFTREVHQLVRNGRKTVTAVQGNQIRLNSADMTPGQYATGDFFCHMPGSVPRLIAANTADTLTLDSGDIDGQGILQTGQPIEISIRLQRPWIDPGQCIGCGVCEHECPVQGRRAIRVTAENESRQKAHRLVLT